MFWQSNCSGSGTQAEFAAKYLAPIPGCYIRHGGSVSQLQIGVNNKIDVTNGNGGYELTVGYDLNLDTGKDVHFVKVDYGGTQIYQDAGSASVSEVTIGTGSKSFTIETGLDYASGDKVIAYNSTGNYMRGICSGYTSGTGAFSMNSNTAVGSGQYSSWTVGKLDWNIASQREFYYEYITEIKAYIDYCVTNNILVKIVLFPIGGEEDGLDATKTAAYEANTKAFLLKARSDIHEYIALTYPGMIIPHIKALIAETKSNSGANGIAIRAAQASIVASNPHNYLLPKDNLILGGDNVHINAAGFMAVGPQAADIIQTMWN